MTFDDGYESQIVNALPLLNERNLKATFFLITGELWFSGHGLNWGQWRQVAEQGHEIGSHTVNHSSLTNLTEIEIRKELSLSQEMINQNIPSQSCISFCYPSNKYNENVISLVGEYYTAARKAGGFMNTYDELNSLLINDIGSFDNLHYYLNCADEFTSVSEKLDCFSQSVESINAWIVFHWHTVQDQEIGLFTKFLDGLISKDIWVDTIGTVSRYMTEKIASTISVVVENSNEIKINVTHSLDPLIYNVPLTIRSSVPQSWAKVQITHENNAQIIEPVMEPDGALVYYNIIPNSGLVQLTPVNPLSPVISKAPDSLTVSSEQEANASEQTFKVWNSGGDNLTYYISVDENWLSCSPENGSSTGEKDTISVNYFLDSLPPGTYFADIYISDDAAENSPQTIPVTLKIDASPNAVDEDGDGFTENQGDCDDTDNEINPAANEICGDGIDQDCDGSDLNCSPDPLDIDDDGDGFTENQGDCDDTDNEINPAANEICGDGIDQDCDATNEECLTDKNNDGGGCFILNILR